MKTKYLDSLSDRNFVLRPIMDAIDANLTKLVRQHYITLGAEFKQVIGFRQLNEPSDRVDLYAHNLYDLK